MARSGSETRQRTIILKARFDAQEAANIRARAEKAGLSVGGLMRFALLNSEPPRAVRRPSIDHEAAARVLGQLGKIGSNVNQIAHHLNAGRPPERVTDSIELALRDLAELRVACLHALGQEPSSPGQRWP